METQSFAPLSRKVWLSSPVMHGDEPKYVTEAHESNRMSAVCANIGEAERTAAKQERVIEAVKACFA